MAAVAGRFGRAGQLQKVCLAILRRRWPFLWNVPKDSQTAIRMAAGPWRDETDRSLDAPDSACSRDSAQWFAPMHDPAGIESARSHVRCCDTASHKSSSDHAEQYG